MITIYSKEKCQQCDSAKMLCMLKGVEYNVKMFEKDFNREDLMNVSSNIRSFPAILVNDEYVGGLKELQQILLENQ